MSGRPRAAVRPVVLDVDPGADDALALLLAAGDPGLDLRGVVVTNGNVVVDRGVATALGVLGLAGRLDVPVVRGAVVTLDGRGPRVGSPHGPDGLAGVRLPAVATSAPDPRTPARLLRDVLRDVPGVTLVLLAPQTSLAQAVRDDPRCLDGTAGLLAAVGSARGEPEFNAGHDAAARARVATAARRRRVPLREVPVEVGRIARRGSAPLVPPAGPCEAPDIPVRAFAAALLAARAGALGDAAVLATLVGSGAARATATDRG